MPPALNLLTINISSLTLHLDSFVDQDFNVSNSRKYDVIGFCETIASMMSFVNSIPVKGITNSYYNNNTTQGGSVAVYINKAFHTHLLTNLCLQLPHNESLFLEITKPHEFFIGMIYRPPNSDVDDFLASITDIIIFTSTCKIPIYIMGDLSISSTITKEMPKILLICIIANNFSLQ